MDRADPEPPDPDAATALDSTAPPLPSAADVPSGPVTSHRRGGEPRRRASRSWRWRSPRRRSWPARAVHVGLHAGRPAPPISRARRSRTTRRSSRSGTPTTRSTTATPAARSTASALVTGAIKGMIESLGDPYSVVPHARRVPPEPAGHQRPVRGDRRRDRDARRRTATQGCTTLGPRLPARGHHADRRARRPRRPGCSPATSSWRPTASSLDGLTVDGARDRIRGPKGIDRRR